MKLKFAEIDCNPYRDLKLNPLRRDKIEALKESINETGFWDNVVVRIIGKKKQSAYGHHRIAAAMELGLVEADFIVKELSNDLMLKMMARENAEVYGNDLISTIESVEALVKAYAQGTLSTPEKLVPGKDTPKTHVRFAPSYVPGKVPSANQAEGPYTVSTVASFLGFTKKDRDGIKPEPGVSVALDFLELRELGIVSKPESLADPETEKVIVRRKDGTIPVAAAHAIIRELKERHNVTMARARVRATQVVEDGAAVQRRLAALQEDQKKAEAAAEKLREQRRAAERDNITKKAEEIKQKLEDKAKAEAERAARIVETKKELRDIEKQRVKSEKENSALAQREADRALAQWNARSKELRDRVDNILSVNDQLYENLLQWTRDKRVTEPQRGLLALALRNLSERAANFNPNPARPIARKGERK